jgi:ferredoxin-fold anticodon binding domain-containing protein
MHNPYAKKILGQFLREAGALKKSVDGRDEKKFVDTMSSSAKVLGDMEGALYKSNKVLATLREELRQLKGMAGKRVALRHEQSGEVHFGLLESVSGEEAVLLEDGKRTSLKIANVKLLSGPEARQARRQKYGVTRRDFSCLFTKGFSQQILPEIVERLCGDVAGAKVVDVYESGNFAGRKSITLRAEILNDSKVKDVEESVMRLLLDLGGEKR